MAEENMQKTAQAAPQQDLNELLRVRREKLAQLQADGKDPFQITKYDVTHHSTEIKDNFDEMEGKTVRIAGRVMSKRVMGKASFCNVQDLKGNIQSYVARDSIGTVHFRGGAQEDLFRIPPGSDGSGAHLFFDGGNIFSNGHG